LSPYAASFNYRQKPSRIRDWGSGDCAYALHTDGMFSDAEIRELLVKNL
jgi:hypothetical protein